MIHCLITSSQKTESYKNLQGITLPAFSGQMQVLPGHAESFILLKTGNVILKLSSGQKTVIPIKGGECYIKDDNSVIIL